MKIKAKIAALVLHLGGKHHKPILFGPAGHRLYQPALVGGGQAAHAKALDDQRPVMGAKPVQQRCIHARYQPQYKHRRIQRVVKPHRLQRGRRQKPDQPLVAEHRGFGVVDAGKSVKAFAAHLTGTGPQNHLAVKHDLHAPPALRPGVGKGTQQVVAGVGIPVIDGLPLMAMATAQRMLSVASVRGCTKGS